MVTIPHFRFGRAAAVRNIMLVLVAVDLALVALASAGAESPLTMPGGKAYVIEAAVPLAIYAVLLVSLFGFLLKHQAPAMDVATSAGIICGLVLITHMFLENFGDRVGENSIVTLAFMLAGFLVSGVAGWRAYRECGTLTAGISASSAGAMISVLMAVTFGLILIAANTPPPDYVATWSEFKSSGWSSPRAFGIANCFEAVLSHLVTGPIAGTIFGLLGVAIARLQATVTR
jgi:hypothetical protein